MCYWRNDANPAPLPDGPWLGRLCRLALPCYLLSDADSLMTLSEARQLQQLGITNVHQRVRWRREGTKHAKAPAPYHTAEVRRILEWAPQHASLQLLVLASLAPEVAAAAAAAQQQRPGLQVVDTKGVFQAACGYEREPTD